MALSGLMSSSELKLRRLGLSYAGGTPLFIQAVRSNPTCPNARLVTVLALQEDVTEVQVIPDTVTTLALITEEPMDRKLKQ